MMRKYLLAFAIALCPFLALAQESGGIGKIALEPYVTPELTGMPEASCNLLKNKLKQVATANGLGGALSQRFVITATTDVLTKDITPTAPPMHAYTVAINFYVGDSMDGVLFSSCSITSQGVGETETKAYNAALKAVKTNSPDLSSMVQTGKKKIVEYYNSIAQDLISKALSLKAAEQYDEAIYTLSVVPNACDRYTEVEKLISEIYLAKIDHEAKPILVEAKALWSAEPSPENAEKVMTILAKIDPDAPCYAEAEALMKKVEAVYIKELERKRALEERAYQDAKAREQREFDKEERRYQDAQAKEQRNFDEAKSRYMQEFELRKAQQQHDNEMDPLRIKAAEKVAVTQARNQPKLDVSQIKGILRAAR